LFDETPEALRQRCDALRRALASRNELLAMVAHDLRNFVGGVLITSEMLERRSESAELRRCAKRQERAARSMLRLLNDLVDSGAFEAGAIRLHLKSHSVTRLVEDAIETFAPAAAQRCVHIHGVLPHSSLLLQCDGDRMAQALANLVGNAVKFSPEGGVVQVRVQRLGAAVEISVCDQGPGFDQAVRQHLFERYCKGDRHGSGLGLHITKQIIDAHHGRLTLETEPGRGSCFRLVLPMNTRGKD
jgi:signal transduction histidine kinase